jgi:hypothetical protein
VTVPQSKRHPARRPEKRPARQSHRPPSSGGPTSSSARRAPVTNISPRRRAFEIRSAGPLAVLNRWPTWLVPALLGVFLVAGLAIPSPWAALFLAPVALFLLWLLLLAWPVLDTRGRIVRVVVVGLTVAAAVAKALGRL